VREYVPGEDLATWSQRCPHTWPDIAALIRKICLGLDHLHRAGLIHGGLCPQNVLVGDGTLKVTDFGTGASFFSPLLRCGEVSPDKRPFLPPWHDDPEAFQRPVTDIYALGALLYLLQQGAPPEGIPTDASLPVQKALRGEYGDIEEFLHGIEALEEEGEETEEQEGWEEEQGKSQGEESDGDGPVPAPRIAIYGDGLEPGGSGLDYLLEKTLKQKGGQCSFVLHNVEEDAREVTVRVSVAAGSDWIQVEPTEVCIPPGTQEFSIRLGPVQTPGVRVGKIVLEISINEDASQISRDILITAEFKQGFLAWIIECTQTALLWLKGLVPALPPLRVWWRSIVRLWTPLATILAIAWGMRLTLKRLIRMAAHCLRVLLIWLWRCFRPWGLYVSIPLAIVMLTVFWPGEKMGFLWPGSDTERKQTHEEGAVVRAQLATLHKQLTAMTRQQHEANDYIARLSNDLATAQEELAKTVQARDTARNQVKALIDKLEAVQKELDTVARARTDGEAHTGNLRPQLSIKQVKNDLLIEGKYVDALRELQGLKASYPDNEEIRALWNQMDKELTIQSDLILPPRQGKMRGEMVSIPSGGGFQLRLTPSDDCYLYIYHLDSQHELVQLFPHPDAARVNNPLRGGSTYHIPRDGNWFILDQTPGQERIYFIASRWPAKDLEELFNRLGHAAGQTEKDEYRHRLVMRLEARSQARVAGMRGFFYKEYAFWHE